MGAGVHSRLAEFEYMGGTGGCEACHGGGSGGAIYNDGNTMTLSISGTLIEHNTVNAYGAAIFFVSNNRTGRVIIEDSVLRANPSDGFGTPGFPGIFYLGDGPIQVSNSIIE